MSAPTESAAWQALEAHQRTLATTHLRDLFAEDPERFNRFSLQACGLLLDYSKNRLTQETLRHLADLAESRDLAGWIQRMFQGDKVNHTENRAALHIALRNRSGRAIEVDGADVMPEVEEVLEKMRAFSDKVRSGEWLGYTGKPIKAIVNIGIGGSDLGPLMVSRALRARHHPRLKGYFVSNIDALQISETLAELDPETTLFIVASKTFTTQETLTNARSARAWFLQHAHDETAIAKHFVAVSTNTEKVTEFGIDPENMFEFWDWVGGRYSLWSAIGLSIILLIGMDGFIELLCGAHAMDEHFRSAPLLQNMPVLLGLIGVWNTNFLGAATQAILPYDYELEYLPSYLQQLEMESNGKRITREGETVGWRTCPVIWGMPGNNGQHAFYQLLHQGTQTIPSDFIVAAQSQSTIHTHQTAVLANALAQTRALMLGRTEEETAEGLRAQGLSEEQIAMQTVHRTFPGNQPSNTIAYRKLNPALLGSLIALYEHKVFVQSVCWGINPFDQWGVELGKQMAADLLPELDAAEPSTRYDASSNGLLNYLKGLR